MSDVLVLERGNTGDGCDLASRLCAGMISGRVIYLF